MTRRSRREYSCRRRRGTISLLILWMLFTGCLLHSCSSPDRDHSLDPVNAPVIDMSDLALSGGAIEIQWRYFSDLPGLTFNLSKAVGGEAFPEDDTDVELVHTFTTGEGAAGQWQSSAFRDSTVTFGTTTFYRVSAVSPAGDQLASRTRAFFVEGVSLLPPVVDPDGARISLAWANVPPDVIGFDLVRTDPSGAARTVFSTEDPALRQFEDTDVRGGAPYTYVLTAHLTNGVAVPSRPVEAVLYPFVASKNVASISPVSRMILVWDIAVHVIGETVECKWGATTLRGRPEETFTPITIENLDVQTLSGGMSPRRGNGPGGDYYLSGVDRENDLLVLKLVDLNVVIEAPRFRADVMGTVTLPAEGVQRTGFATFGDLINFQTTLFFAGNTLRVLDDSLGVIETRPIESGEPVDINFQDGAIWLAYPDRLLKSNPVQSLAGITMWQDIPLPENTTITAISRFRGQLLLLDAVAGTLSLLNPDGTVVIDWDARGEGLELGDVQEVPGQFGPSVITQSDGRGNVYTFEKEPLQ